MYSILVLYKTKFLAKKKSSKTLDSLAHTCLVKNGSDVFCI